MKVNFGFFSLVIRLIFAKSWRWMNEDEDIIYFHIGTFTDNKHTAIKIIIGPVLLMFGFSKKVDK
jgi:hypothetical protein